MSVYRTHDKSATTHGNNELYQYLKEISRFSLLTREDEVALARAAKAGSRDAKQKLIESNLRFVVRVAKRYQGQGLPLMDLIAEGNLGLCEAVERFDVERGHHFITYAVWWIKQAILKALSEKSRMIRLPYNRANQLLHIEKARREIVKSGDKKPDNEKIARYLNLDSNYVRTLIDISRDVLSLEKPLSPKGDGAAISDMMEDDKAENPEVVAVNRTLRESIEDVLSTLNAREAEIILLRFGLRGDRPLSLKEIGERYNLTKERIRQIEKNALKRLRHPKRISRLAHFNRG